MISQIIRDLMMVIYLNIAEKHAFNMPKFSFKLYSNIVIPNWLEFDRLGPKRVVVEADFKLSNKVSVI
jgi:hypothetical protein